MSTPTSETPEEPEDLEYNAWIQIHAEHVGNIYHDNPPKVSPYFIQHAIELAAMMSHAPENTIKPYGMLPTKTRYSKRTGKISSRHGRGGSLGKTMAYLRGDRMDGRRGLSKGEKKARRNRIVRIKKAMAAR